MFVWLLGGLIGWPIQYLHRAISPATANDYLPFEILFGNACAVFYFLLKWPRLLTLSRIKPRLGDLAVGLLLGYLDINLGAVIVGKSDFLNDPILTFPAKKLTFICAVLVVPLVEELIYRGFILGSLSHRTSTFWAIAITALGATVMHDYWPAALPSQVLLCAAYLIQGRSLPASIIAHAVGNAAIFAPTFVLVLHFMK